MFTTKINKSLQKNEHKFKVKGQRLKLKSKSKCQWVNEFIKSVYVFLF